MELVFDLEPKRFKDIDLQEIILRKFYLQSQEETILGKKPKDVATLDPTEILDRLYTYLTSQGVDWQHLPEQIKNKAISFAFDIAQRKWKSEFGKDPVFAVNNLSEAIEAARVKRNYLMFEAFNLVRLRNIEINKLEREIAQKGILKELSLSAGGRLNRNGPLQLEYYQLDNILRMRQEKKVILADDPGLGKTIQVLVYALLENSQEIFIGVGPLLAKESFKRDLDKWIKWKIDFVEVTNKLSPQDRESLLLRKSPRTDGTQARLQLWRMDDLPRVVKGIGEIPAFDFVGLDEAHYIKNNESQRSRAAQLLKADHVVLATATPVDNHVEDLRVLSKMVLNLEDVSIPRELGDFLNDDANFLRLFSSKRLDTIALLRSLIKRKLIRNRITDVRGNIRDVEAGVLALDIKNGFMTIRNEKGEERKVDLKTHQERAGNFDTFVKQRELYARVYRWVQQKGNEKFRLTGVNVLRHILSDVRGVVDNVIKGSAIDNEAEEGEAENVSQRANSELYEYIKSSIEELDREFPAQGWIGIKERMIEKINSEFKDQKFLVLVGFKGSLAEYQRILGNANTGIIAGDIKQQDRVKVQQGFNNGVYQHVITTYGTGGMAADFSPADVLLLETPPSKGSERRQALGRVVRVNDNGVIFEHPLYFYDAIVEPWQDNLRSADVHYQSLNRYKELLALMLEDGVITKEVVDELKNIDREFLKGFFGSNDAAMMIGMSDLSRLMRNMGSSMGITPFLGTAPEAFDIPMRHVPLDATIVTMAGELLSDDVITEIKLKDGTVVFKTDKDGRRIIVWPQGLGDGPNHARVYKDPSGLLVELMGNFRSRLTVVRIKSKAVSAFDMVTIDYDDQGEMISRTLGGLEIDVQFMALIHPLWPFIENKIDFAKDFPNNPGVGSKGHWKSYLTFDGRFENLDNTIASLGLPAGAVIHDSSASSGITSLSLAQRLADQKVRLVFSDRSFIFKMIRGDDFSGVVDDQGKLVTLVTPDPYRNDRWVNAKLNIEKLWKKGKGVPFDRTDVRISNKNRGRADQK